MDPPRAFSDELVSLMPQIRKYARKAFPAVWEDVAQETALKAWANWEKFTLGTNMKAWLLTIMWCVFKTTNKRAKLFVEDVDGRQAAALVSEPTQEIFLEFEDHRRALARLSVRRRAIAIAVDLDGQSHLETAMQFGVELGTIKSNMSRARAAYA